jgi:hypothetical protein
MNREDLQQIKELLHEEVPSMVRAIIKEEVPSMVRTIIREEVPSMIRTIIKEEVPLILGEWTEEVILPAVERIVDSKIEPLRQDIGQIKIRYPDKAYLDDKICGLRGDIISWRKKDGARLDKLIFFQHRKKFLTKEEVKELDAMRDFAPLPT